MDYNEYLFDYVPVPESPPTMKNGNFDERNEYVAATPLGSMMYIFYSDSTPETLRNPIVDTNSIEAVENHNDVFHATTGD